MKRLHLALTMNRIFHQSVSTKRQEMYLKCIKRSADLSNTRFGQFYAESIAQSALMSALVIP